MNETSAMRGLEAKPLSEVKRRLLQAYLGGDLGQNRERRRGITRRSPEEVAPLSPVQEQIWLHEMEAPGAPPFYNESFTMQRHGSLDRIALTRSLTEIVRRHEIWRTCYDVIAGHMVQVVHPAPAAVPLQVVDLRQIPEAARETETLQAGDEDARRPFDLTQGPLLRFTLVTLNDEEHRLFITAHQSIVDGVSVYRVFPSELTVLYEAFSKGNPSPLPELAVQYADFSLWERGRLQGEVRDNQLSYWREQLAGKIETLHWPSSRPPFRSFRGAVHPFDVPMHLTAALRRLSQEEGVTLFMTLTAGFAALLHHYTHQRSLVIGTLGSAGRKHPEMQALLGYFLNPLALRIDFSHDYTFRELLTHVSKVVMGALTHEDVPFEDVVREVAPNPDPRRHPLFQVAISLAPSVPELGPGWKQSVMDVQSGGSKWDLYLEFSESAEGLMGRAQYNPDVFEAATIEQTVEDLLSLLAKAALNSGQELQPLLESTPSVVDQLASRNASVA